MGKNELKSKKIRSQIQTKEMPVHIPGKIRYNAL